MTLEGKGSLVDALPKQCYNTCLHTKEQTMFTLANVKTVYSGRPGCMCGCRGKYTTPEQSARSVKILFNKVMNHPNREVEDNCAFVDTGTRNLVVYFKH